MFCPNCGNQCPDGTKFCQSCGTPLTNNQQQNTHPDFNNQQPNQQYQQPNYNQYQQPNQYGNRCTINRISSTHSIPINSTDIRWVGTNF